MAQFYSPLVQVLSDKPQGEPQVGDLLTVNLVRCDGKGSGFVRSGARLEEVRYGTYFVKLCGLIVPPPYEIGEQLPLSREKIVDWG